MMPLRSHPHLRLGEHIAQVIEAMEGIFQWHSQEVVTDSLRRNCNLLARLHDLGKGTRAFQEYIADPPAYRGDREEKSHTPLSLLLTLCLAQCQNWDAGQTLALAASARGHHSRFPTLEELRKVGLGETPRLLKRQCAMLNLQALEQETGMDLMNISLDGRPWAMAKRYLDNVIKPLVEVPIEDASRMRLRAQLLFSILLEADKAFLAVSDPMVRLRRPRRVWDPTWVDKRIGTPGPSLMNEPRQSARSTLIHQMNRPGPERIFSLTAPTGMGKTLLAATWALSERQRIAKETGVSPKIIVVLPFLSIIDQTAREYEALLKQGAADIDGSWFLTFHSLADRVYGEDLEESAEGFFVETWRTELVITTYDQFLLTLVDTGARYQMRFHNLCDALVIMDEVQSLPCRLWKPLEMLLKSLVEIGNSRILLMSATLPAFVSGTRALLPDCKNYFRSLRCYRLHLRIHEKMLLQDFVAEACDRLPGWLAEGRRVLITLNTRRSARRVRDALEAAWPPEFCEVPLLFISADVTPLDRLKTIHRIAAGDPCLVVSTQCVEAGVDIDLDCVIRDFAPLDSLIQIAGRCNRGGRRERGGVEIVDLVAKNGRRFSEMIYDDIHLQETWSLLRGLEFLDEEQVLEMSNGYFAALACKMNLGQEHLLRFARWEKDVPIREILRGKEKEQYAFVVVEQDPELRSEMEAAAATEDRWRRREAWRRLAGRIARVSVSVFARRGFDPQDIADFWCEQWILREGYYDSSRGLILPDDQDDGGALIL